MGSLKARCSNDIQLFWSLRSELNVYIRFNTVFIPYALGKFFKKDKIWIALTMEREQKLCCPDFALPLWIIYIDYRRIVCQEGLGDTWKNLFWVNVPAYWKTCYFHNQKNMWVRCIILYCFDASEALVYWPGSLIYSESRSRYYYAYLYSVHKLASFEEAHYFLGILLARYGLTDKLRPGGHTSFVSVYNCLYLSNASQFIFMCVYGSIL